jgi:hypothetical protein
MSPSEYKYYFDSKLVCMVMNHSSGYTVLWPLMKLHQSISWKYHSGTSYGLEKYISLRHAYWRTRPDRHQIAVMSSLSWALGNRYMSLGTIYFELQSLYSI